MDSCSGTCVLNSPHVSSLSWSTLIFYDGWGSLPLGAGVGHHGPHLSPPHVLLGVRLAFVSISAVLALPGDPPAGDLCLVTPLAGDPPPNSGGGQAADYHDRGTRCNERQ